MSTEQLGRWAIGFVWMYHGLATKLITVAPIEYYLSSQFGFSEAGTFWFIKACGVYELAFGVAFSVLGFMFSLVNQPIHLSTSPLLQLILRLP